MSRILAWMVVLIAGVPAWASDEFLMRAPRAYVEEIAARFGLAILQQVPGHDLFLVRGPAGVTPAQVMAWVRNYDHNDNDTDDDDDDDVMIEQNTLVDLPELTTPFTSLIGSTQPAWNALADLTTTNFFGDVLWSSFVRQPAVAHIRVPAAHNLATGAGIIAVIDTGIDPNHPALSRWLVPGFDFVRNQAGFPSELDDLDPATRALINPYTTAIIDTVFNVNPYTTAIIDQATAALLDPARLPPGFGHGTMVAGLIRLVAPTSLIMPLKPFGADGKATRFNVIRAIYYAQAQGARVINMSLGFATSSPEMALAVKYVSDRGVTCVASAGNAGLQVDNYPASYQEVIGIASTNLADQRSFFSNHGGNLVRVAAPGEGLIAPYPGRRWAAVWGTSFSTPLVSGTVGLMLHVKPQLGWKWADAALSEAAPAGGNLGSGRVDVFRAVQKAAQF